MLGNSPPLGFLRTPKRLIGGALSPPPIFLYKGSTLSSLQCYRYAPSP